MAWDEGIMTVERGGIDVRVDGLEPDPKVIEQYQHVVIHASLRRDGVNDDMD